MSKPDHNLPELKKFKPCSIYLPEMDVLLYLREDCSYRAEQVDASLDVLWHPYEEALVGVKLCGFRGLFEQLGSRLDLQERTSLPLSPFLEMAFCRGMSRPTAQNIDEITRQYNEARVIIGDAVVEKTDWPQTIQG